MDETEPPRGDIAILHVPDKRYYDWEIDPTKAKICKPGHPIVVQMPFNIIDKGLGCLNCKIKGEVIIPTDKLESSDGCYIKGWGDMSGKYFYKRMCFHKFF